MFAKRIQQELTQNSSTYYNFIWMCSCGRLMMVFRNKWNDKCSKVAEKYDQSVKYVFDKSQIDFFELIAFFPTFSQNRWDWLFHQAYISKPFSLFSHSCVYQLFSTRVENFSFHAKNEQNKHDEFTSPRSKTGKVSERVVCAGNQCASIGESMVN